MEHKAVEHADCVDNRKTHRQRAAILTGLLAIVSLLGWMQWRALGSMRDTYDAALAQFDQMQADAARIHTLQQTPQAALGRTRANEELLAQVEESLKAAGIDPTSWHDSIPQLPVRLPQSDYKRMTTQVYLEGIAMQQLAAFTHHLRVIDPALRVSSLNITSRERDSLGYDADLGVSYLVFAPREERRGYRQP